MLGRSARPRAIRRDGRLERPAEMLRADTLKSMDEGGVSHSTHQCLVRTEGRDDLQ